MELTPEDKAQMKANFDKCDAALLDKPILASIYDGNWRKDLREKALSSQKHGEVTYGAIGYAAPFFEEIGICPRCYQSRLEEGASVLLPKISKQEREHIVKRMQGLIPISAEQELLLARGFRDEFETSAVKAPQGPENKPRPEVDQYYVQGVWFNLSVAQRIGISEQTKERIRTAVKNSFWPRPDGVLLHEGMSDDEHSKKLSKI